MENYDIPIETELQKTDPDCPIPFQQPTEDFIDENHTLKENGSSKNIEQCLTSPDTSTQFCCAFDDDFDEFIFKNYAALKY